MKKRIVYFLSLMSISILSLANEISQDINNEQELHELVQYNISQSRNDKSRSLDYLKLAMDYAKITLSSADDLMVAEELINIGLEDIAINYLSEYIEIYPDNIDVKLTLAKYLSWYKRPKTALTYVDSVLQIEPDNQEALLIKANALSWQGDKESAIDVYESRLYKSDSFDVRINYTYALLQSGEIGRASTSFHRLESQSSDQTNEIIKLREELKRSRSESFHSSYRQFTDSDNNTIDDIELSVELPGKFQQWSFYFNSKTAFDQEVQSTQDKYLIGGNSNLSPGLKLTTNFGALKNNQRESEVKTIGALRITRRFRNWHVSLQYQHDAMEQTAKTIYNNLMMDSVVGSVIYYATDHMTLFQKTEYRKLSDDNSSLQNKLDLRYQLPIQLSVFYMGYRHEYLDFDKEKHVGYFDPQQLQTHLAYLNLHAYLGSARIFAEANYGYQNFEFYNNHNKNQIFGWNTHIQWQLMRSLLIRVNWEGGNFALNNDNAYTYNQWSGGITWLTDV